MLGFDTRVISMYARGMSAHKIQGPLLKLYGLQVLPDLISKGTDGVRLTWRNRSSANSRSCIRSRTSTRCG